MATNTKNASNIFQHDYLNELQQKSKRFREKSQPQVNELVLVKDENLAPAKWPMARITEVHPGDDNRVRVVTLKMKNSFLQRPITKIAPLPIEANGEVHSHCINIRSKKSTGKTIPIILAMLALFNSMRMHFQLIIMISILQRSVLLVIKHHLGYILKKSIQHLLVMLNGIY